MGRIKGKIGKLENGLFDLLIVTIINWIMRTIMVQVVCTTDATHVSLMWPTCFCSAIVLQFLLNLHSM